MKSIELNIPYNATDDDFLQVRYVFDGDCECNAVVLPLREVAPGEWHAVISVGQSADSLSYRYECVRNGRVVRREWGLFAHTLRINSVNSRYLLFDRWVDSPAGYYLHTSLFCMFNALPPVDDGSGVNWYNRSVTVSLPLLGLQPGEHPVLVGDATVLGEWNVPSAPAMHRVEQNMWSVTFDAATLLTGCIHFKIALLGDDGGVRWEEGDNRTITLPDFQSSSAYSYTYDALSFPSPMLRLAGTVIPLFSLRTERSWGIGDFGDIAAMTDWLEHTGQNVLQLLPVNDTTVSGGKEDSYPYNCVSVFALNPIYACMSALPPLDSERRNRYYEKRRLPLNALPVVDYAAVYMLKMSYLRELFVIYGDETLASDACRLFVREQEEWLRPYAMYRFLISRLSWNIEEWGEYRRCNEGTYSRLTAEYPESERELRFYIFVQYILYSQLTDAHRYANSKRVALKGDIPIGVAPNGVDVWCNSEQFNLSVSAGAPPDAFSANGQNWGFPTYNWQRMATDGYAWWRRRLQYMANFFDAYRIDHILGFFRIWEIPRWAVSGLAGAFSPSMPLTPDEILAAGFPFDKERHTTAYVRKETVRKLFGRKSKYVLEHYLDECTDGSFVFKEQFRSPQSLHADLYSFESPLSYELKETLLGLFGEVLFFPADADGKAFTPRIDASATPLYATLATEHRAAYDRLYEDYFYHRHTGYWYEEGMRKLMPVLHSTSMTACGEDLGMIPACVPWVMKNLQILSLEIQRMPKIYGQAFARPLEYPYLSVATPSTHDMSTLRGWWREDAAATQRFYSEILRCDGIAPSEMSGTVANAIIRSHMESPSLLALFAWQDLLAADERLRRDNPDDERINVPSNRNHVWNYRMHLTVEQMMQERSFNDALRSMIEECGRGAK